MTEIILENAGTKEVRDDFFFFFNPEMNKVFNSNETVISLIANENLEVIYTTSYFCKEHILKDGNNFGLMNSHIPVEFQSFASVLKVSVKLYS